MAYLQRKTQPRPQRMCGNCSQICSYSYLICSECASWLHTNCDGLDEEKGQQFQHLPLDFPYICRKCRCDEDGNLDYTKVMQRLHKAAVEGFTKLKRCVKRESLFLDGGFLGFSGMGSLAVDGTAAMLLKKYFNNDRGVPAVTSTMDHVLFRAVSLAVCAKDSLAIELRARCCIEMVAFDNFYKYQKNHEELARYSPDYTESCIDCALIDEGSSLWTMAALASVVRRPILSVYPHVNGSSDPLVRILNRPFSPRQGEINNQVVRILWSSVNVELGPGWKPNHFVPIFDQHKDNAKNPNKRSASEMEEGPEIEEEIDDSIEDEDSSSEPSSSEKIPMEKAEGGQPIEFEKFLDVFEAFEKITTATMVHSAIPRGVKENVWFLIDNSHNVRHPERRNTFFDDCGVWDSKQGSVAKSYLLLDDSDFSVQCTLKLHQGVYQKCVKINGKNEWQVLDPQPDPEKVVICHRYYAFLKRCKEYKRRIIWFDMPHIDDRGSEVALVEYLGEFPRFPKPSRGPSKRGKGGKSNYVRTDPKLLEEIATQIRSGNSMKPMKMYKEIQKKLGSDCTLRDARQIRNLKYSVLKRLKKEQGGEGEEVEIGVEGDKIEVGLAPTEAPQISIRDENGAAVVMEAMGDDSQAGVKYIIHHTGDDGTTLMESLEGVEGLTQGGFVEMVDGQQAITLINTDANGLPDPSTQTIIMVNNIKDLEAITGAGGEVIVSQEAL
ncbi:hypothetical protein ACOMHN_049609 [Nucella lapillus]